MSSQPAFVTEEGTTGGCPVRHTAPAASGCPVAHGQGGTVVAPRRSPADIFMRRLLFVRERPVDISPRAAETSFRRSMLISGTRCLLTYVMFPFVLPAIGIVTGVGPIVGIAIGTFAITCDVFTVRRFFAADHRWRWYIGPICIGVIGLLLVLLVEDISHLVT